MGGMPATSFQERSRVGVTPVVSVVLLLMMTVAAAGAAYGWFTQIQNDIQAEASRQFETDMSTKDLRCIRNATGSYIFVALKNSGSRDVEGAEVDLFIYDNNNNIFEVAENLDWSAQAFTNAGEFDQVTERISRDLTEGSFYTVEADFTLSGSSFPLGPCIAE